MICSYISEIEIDKGTWWGDLLFLWVSKQKAKVKASCFVWEKSLFLSTHFISMNNNEWLVHNVTTLMKIFFVFWEHHLLIYVTCLIRKDL
jgi:hypothetical protein